MMVTGKMDFAEYYLDHNGRIDCIYDEKLEYILKEHGFHRKTDYHSTDISGSYVLISSHFTFFGANPIKVPDQFKQLAPDRQGHRSRINDPFESSFIRFFESLE